MKKYEINIHESDFTSIDFEDFAPPTIEEIDEMIKKQKIKYSHPKVSHLCKIGNQILPYFMCAQNDTRIMHFYSLED